MSVAIEPDSEWQTVVDAVRRVHPRVPVVVFGGHHHASRLFLKLHARKWALIEQASREQVRQCARYDEYSMGFAAGRYMETIGFMSELPRFSPLRLSSELIWTSADQACQV